MLVRPVTKRKLNTFLVCCTKTSPTAVVDSDENHRLMVVVESCVVGNVDASAEAASSEQRWLGKRTRIIHIGFPNTKHIRVAAFGGATYAPEIYIYIVFLKKNKRKQQSQQNKFGARIK